MCLSQPLSTIPKMQLHDRLLAVRVSLLSLQEAVAKHNAAIRARYPQSDAVFKSFERAMMGVFNDIPLQVHAFSHAAETVAYDCKELPMHPSDLFSDGVIDELNRAKTWAGAPQRSTQGKIIWKRSVSHVEAQLAKEIARRASIFFNDVYALPGIDRESLKREEKDFWTRYAKLVAAHARAKLDTGVKKDVRVALGKSLPDAVCWVIAAYVQ